MLEQKSLFIQVPNSQDRLHLKRIFNNPQGVPVFMMHGSIENGKIFYSQSLKGLAPYLAQRGFDVFIADLRGKGESTPPVSRKSTYNQTTTLKEDIPLFLSKIRQIKGGQPMHWLAHSWGGVLLLSYLARNPEELVYSMSFLATKRAIGVFNMPKFIKVDLGWTVLGEVLKLLYGYLPAKALSFGSDNEPRNFHSQVNRWIYGARWVDAQDGFDYAAQFKKINLPPTLHITGVNDRYLGHPKDVKRMADEVGNPKDEVKVLSIKNGNKQDYDHINICTHPDAIDDHFPMILDWMHKHEEKPTAISHEMASGL